MALPAGRYGLTKKWVNAMGNLKLKHILPFLEDGEWHKITIIKKNDVVSVYSTLDGVVKTSNYITFPLGYYPLPITFNVESDMEGSTYTTIITGRGVDGKWYKVLPPNNFSKVVFYVYVFKEKNILLPALLSDNPVQSVRKVAKASKVEEPVEETTEPIEEPINTDTE